jgi:Ca2+-binding RTX toxin-like protein
VSGNNAGSYNTATTFAGMAYLVGGTGTDTFKFSDGATISGGIDGGAGTNAVNYSAYTTVVTVNLADGSATGVAAGADGALANISNATGGMSNNVLVGNAAANVLTGGKGRNIIIGGAGADTLTAGPQEDLLIAGTTSYDMNDAALAAIATEWFRSDRGFAQRLADLSGNGADDYQGPYLVSDSSGSPASTVFDDAAIDTLVGNTSASATDWFFARTSGANVDLLTKVTVHDAISSI